MIWEEAIGSATHRLETLGGDEARITAELLALHVLGLWKRSELRSYLNQVLTAFDRRSYEEAVERRLRREPLQYIIGETEFYGLRLFTSPSALIPRPETEHLVEVGLDLLATLDCPKPVILDLGTGTGAIALALANRIPAATVYGVDVSAPAIQLADQNRERLDLRNVRFAVADITASNWLSPFEARVHLLVSNPPYISLADYEELEPELRLFEPRNALTDEFDGLLFYRRILEIASRLVTRDGYIVLELSHSIAAIVSDIAVAHRIEPVKILPDLAGIERVWVGRSKRMV